MLHSMLAAAPPRQAAPSCVMPRSARRVACNGSSRRMAAAASAPLRRPARVLQRRMRLGRSKRTWGWSLKPPTACRSFWPTATGNASAPRMPAGGGWPAAFWSAWRKPWAAAHRSSPGLARPSARRPTRWGRMCMPPWPMPSAPPSAPQSARPAPAQASGSWISMRWRSTGCARPASNNCTGSDFAPIQTGASTPTGATAPPPAAWQR